MDGIEAGEIIGKFLRKRQRHIGDALHDTLASSEVLRLSWCVISLPPLLKARDDFTDCGRPAGSRMTEDGAGHLVCWVAKTHAVWRG